MCGAFRLLYQSVKLAASKFFLKLNLSKSLTYQTRRNHAKAASRNLYIISGHMVYCNWVGFIEEDKTFFPDVEGEEE